MVIFGKEAKAHFISLYICYLSLHLYPLPYSDFPGLMFLSVHLMIFKRMPGHLRRYAIRVTACERAIFSRLYTTEL